MNLKDLEGRAAALMEKAMDQGADEAEVVGVHRTVSRINFEKNDFQLASTNTMLRLGLEVHRDSRKGSASTNESRSDELADTARKALTLASFSLPDEHLCFPGAQKPEDLPGRFDPELAELPAEKLRGFAESFLDAGRHPKISIDGADLEVSTTQRVVANSKGLAVSDRSTRLAWVLSGMGKTEEEVTSFDWLTESAQAWRGADERSLATARRFQEKVLACFGPEKGRSYKGRVLLAPAVLEELLFGPMEFHISGRQIMDGKSRWAEALGEVVASGALTITDDPFDMGLHSTPFDAEGVATRPMPIIEGGVLKTQIDSTYTAKRRGTKSTGHAGGLHGLVVAPGDKKIAELRAMADPLVVVERFSGNLDPVTGDFSGVAKNSHWYEGGQRRHALTETMIAGNFFEMLKDIVALGDEVENHSNSYRAPWILVDGISVTAG